jgi:hypothetical protein
MRNIFLFFLFFIFTACIDASPIVIYVGPSVEDSKKVYNGMKINRYDNFYIHKQDEDIQPFLYIQYAKSENGCSVNIVADYALDYSEDNLLITIRPICNGWFLGKNLILNGFAKTGPNSIDYIDRISIYILDEQ